MKGMRIISIAPDPTTPDTAIVLAIKHPTGDLYYGAISAAKLGKLIGEHVDLRRSVDAPLATAV